MPQAELVCGIFVYTIIYIKKRSFYLCGLATLWLNVINLRSKFFIYDENLFSFKIALTNHK